MTIFLASSVTPAVAIYLVNLAIAAVLISSCGLLAVLLFSRQSAPVRHAILVSTLVLTLLAPGMTWLACQNGWGQIAAIALADDEAKRPTPAPEAAPEKDPAVRTTPDTSLPDSALPAFPFALKLRKSASQEDTRAITSAPAAPQASAAVEGIAGQPARGSIVAAYCNRAGRMGMAPWHADWRGPRRPRLSCLKTFSPLAGSAVTGSP